VISFTVYGQPAPAGSKTAGRTSDGRTFIRDSSKKSYPWKQKIEQVAGDYMSGTPLLDGPLILGLEFYVPRPKGHFGVRGLRPSAPKVPTVRPDLLKLARAVEDALSGIVYRDDAQIVREILDKFYGEPARCEVRIYQMDERQQAIINSGPGEEAA
jgi:Holliday junction resolvase RusA-like endonuclease